MIQTHGSEPAITSAAHIRSDTLAMPISIRAMISARDRVPAAPRPHPRGIVT